METVLVTGGTGFLGSWCIHELLNRGYAVRTTVRKGADEAVVRGTLTAGPDFGERVTILSADLGQDAGWDTATEGSDYVLHLASPLGADTDTDDQLLIAAREGTLRVLKAAVAAGVKRVVMTSSTAASSPPLQGGDSRNDETVWTNPDDKPTNAYRRSKVLAEKAAWDYMAGTGGTTTLTTILPCAIFGPLLTAGRLGSVQVIARLLSGRVAGCPPVGFSIVDVRDVADIHIRAMTSLEAAGERFIAAGDFMWMSDIARTLRAEFGTQAGKVPTRSLPGFALRLAALADPALKLITPTLGRRHTFSSAKARRVLGWTPKPSEETVVACAASLLAHNAL